MLYNPEGVFSGSKRKKNEIREWTVANQALSTTLGQRSTVKLHTEGNTPVACFYVLPPPIADGGNPPELRYHNELASIDVLKAVDTSDIDDVVYYLKANLRWTFKENGSNSGTNGTGFKPPHHRARRDRYLHPAVEMELHDRPHHAKSFDDLLLTSNRIAHGTKTVHLETTSEKASGASS
ncbi:hypothetical protein EAE96_010492 [Botrytis aclada]|nr:hypothetical protein EAE96_010492 [Botrytis aclada]